jgi:hypothetical protein
MDNDIIFYTVIGFLIVFFCSIIGIIVQKHNEDLNKIKKEVLEYSISIINNKNAKITPLKEIIIKDTEEKIEDDDEIIKEIINNILNKIEDNKYSKEQNEIEKNEYSKDLKDIKKLLDEILQNTRDNQIIHEINENKRKENEILNTILIEEIKETKIFNKRLENEKEENKEKVKKEKEENEKQIDLDKIFIKIKNLNDSVNAEKELKKNKLKNILESKQKNKTNLSKKIFS